MRCSRDKRRDRYEQNNLILTSNYYIGPDNRYVSPDNCYVSPGKINTFSEDCGARTPIEMIKPLRYF